MYALLNMYMICFIDTIHMLSFDNYDIYIYIIHFTKSIWPLQKRDETRLKSTHQTKQHMNFKLAAFIILAQKYR